MSDNNKSKSQLIIELEALKRQNADLRCMYLEPFLNKINAAVVVHDSEGNIVSCNRHAEEMLNVDRNTMMGRKVIDTEWNYIDLSGSEIPVDDYPVYQVLRNGRKVTDFCLGITKRGSDDIKWFVVNASPLNDDKGKILQVVVTFMDITKLKTIEKEMHQSEARLKQVLELIPHYLFARDEDGVFILVNKASAESFGHTPESINGQNIRDIHPDTEYVEHILKSDRSIINTGTVSFEKVQRFVNFDGRERIYSVTKIPFKESGSDKNAILGISIDISDIKETEHELRSYQKKLRSLSRELSLTEEREKKKIAAYIHDEIGQTLVAIKMKLSIMQKNLTDSDQVDKLNDVLVLLKKTISDSRHLTSELSPPFLDELGLDPSLEWLGNTIFKDTEINFEFFCDNETKTLNHETKFVAFHSVREALVNIMKHSNANCAKVISTIDDDCIHLIVEDDGVGFDVDKTTRQSLYSDNFGLFNIRERIETIDGSLKINSCVDIGTKLEIILPISLNITQAAEA